MIGSRRKAWLPDSYYGTSCRSFMTAPGA